MNPTGFAEEGSGDNIEISEITSSALSLISPAGNVYGPYSLHQLTITTSSFTVPAVGSTVTIALSGTAPYNTAWMYVGLPLNILSAGAYTVVSFTATSAVVRNIGTPSDYDVVNAAPGTTIAASSNVGIAVLPNVLGRSLIIDPANILGTGDGEALTDGAWSFDWVVKGAYGGTPTPFHARCLKKVPVLCDVECCVDGLNAKIDAECGCSKGPNKKASMANLTLIAAKASFKKGDLAAFNRNLANLQSICNNTCKNC
jgi:hypothetical protein